MRGGLAFERGVHGEDDLVDAARRHPLDQLADAEVLGANPFERREPPAEHVVAAGEQLGPVERPQVGDVLDHAQQARVAAGIGANATRIARVDIAADMALDECVPHRRERLKQLPERRLAPLDQPQDRPPRRTRAEARKAGERRAQRLDLLRCHGPADRALDKGMEPILLPLEGGGWVGVCHTDGLDARLRRAPHPCPSPPGRGMEGGACE